MSDKEAKQEAGLKYDAGKPPLDLLDREALTEIAKVLAYGAGKYASHNWRKGMSWSRLLAAALRHIEAFNDGETTDSETGLSHLAHAGCCIMFLLNFQKTHPELDDRYKAEKPGDDKILENDDDLGSKWYILGEDNCLRPDPVQSEIVQNKDYTNPSWSIYGDADRVMFKKSSTD